MRMGGSLDSMVGCWAGNGDLPRWDRHERKLGPRTTIRLSDAELGPAFGGRGHDHHGGRGVSIGLHRSAGRLEG
jgi:hypothetical protein